MENRSTENKRIEVGDRPLIKIFVSSTFADMQAERDAIHSKLLPRLRRKALEYGESVDFIDLRWGINTADIERDAEKSAEELELERMTTVLDFCFKKIGECRPFMLVMLGERYGSAPEKSKINDVVNRMNLAKKEETNEFRADDIKEKSYTELEIRFGPFTDAEIAKNTVFMMREPIEGAPPLYSNADLCDDKKMKNLKRAIYERSDSFSKIDDYTLFWVGNEDDGHTEGIDEFVDKLYENLCKILEPTFKKMANAHPCEIAQKRNRTFFAKKAQRFSSSKLLRTCLESLSSDKDIVYICSPAGGGKSVAAGKLLFELEKRGVNVFAYCTGLTPESKSTSNLWREACWYLEELLDIEHTDYEERYCDKYAHELLARYSKTESKQLVLIVDGIDKFEREPGVYENNILSTCYENVKYVYTLNLDTECKSLDYNDAVIRIKDCVDTDDVVDAILSSMGKDLSSSVIELIKSKHGNKRPFYLSLLLLRLDMIDGDDLCGNDKLTRPAPGEKLNLSEDQTSRVQSKIIESAPNTEEELALMLVEEMGERFPKKFVTAVTSYIAAGRQGWRRSDLSNLLERDGIKWSEIDFLCVTEGLGEIFSEDTSGRVRFSSEAIKAAVLDNIDEPYYNARIFSYLLSRAYERDPIVREELPYYCYRCNEKDEIVRIVNRDYGFAKSLAYANIDFAGWYADILSNDESAELSRATVDFNNNALERYDTKHSRRVMKALYAANVTLAKRILGDNDSVMLAKAYLNLAKYSDMGDALKLMKHAVDIYPIPDEFCDDFAHLLLMRAANSAKGAEYDEAKCAVDAYRTYILPYLEPGMLYCERAFICSYRLASVLNDFENRWHTSAYGDEIYSLREKSIRFADEASVYGEFSEYHEDKLWDLMIQLTTGWNSEKAREDVEEEVRIFKKLATTYRLKRKIPEMLEGYASYCKLSGDEDSALRAAEEAERACEDIGYITDILGVGIVVHHKYALAEEYLRRERSEEALALCEECIKALKIKRHSSVQTDDPYLLISEKLRLYGLYIEILLSTGSFEKAKEEIFDQLKRISLAEEINDFPSLPDKNAFKALTELLRLARNMRYGDDGIKDITNAVSGVIEKYYPHRYTELYPAFLLSLATELSKKSINGIKPLIPEMERFLERVNERRNESPYYERVRLNDFEIKILELMIDYSSSIKNKESCGELYLRYKRVIGFAVKRQRAGCGDYLDKCEAGLYFERLLHVAKKLENKKDTERVSKKILSYTSQYNSKMGGKRYARVYTKRLPTTLTYIDLLSEILLCRSGIKDAEERYPFCTAEHEIISNRIEIAEHLFSLSGSYARHKLFKKSASAVKDGLSRIYKIQAGPQYEYIIRRISAIGENLLGIALTAMNEAVEAKAHFNRALELAECAFAGLEKDSFRLTVKYNILLCGSDNAELEGILKSAEDLYLHTGAKRYKKLIKMLTFT